MQAHHTHTSTSSHQRIISIHVSMQQTPHIHIDFVRGGMQRKRENTRELQRRGLCVRVEERGRIESDEKKEERKRVHFHDRICHRTLLDV